MSSSSFFCNYSVYFYSMKFQFWTIGKKHEPYVLKASKISPIVSPINTPFSGISSPVLKMQPRSANKTSKKKGREIILNMLQKDDYLVALDERGKQFSSEKLAQFIETRAADRVKNLIFLIGGAYGIDEAVMKRSITNGASASSYSPINSYA